MKLNVESIVSKIPYWCNSKNALRERDILLYQYKKELVEKSGIFSKNYVDRIKPFNRLKTAFIFTGNIFRVYHCKNILKLLLLLHYKNFHNETQWNSKISNLKFKVNIGNKLFSDIAKEAPLDAIVSARWDG
jgi:hypothetical protein